MLTMEHENNYTDAVETLSNMFGDVVSRDVISAVVEHCNGNLEMAAEAVITIASDGDCEMVNTETQVTNEEANITNKSSGIVTNVDICTTNETTNKMDTGCGDVIALEDIPLPQAPFCSEVTVPNNIPEANNTSSVSLCPVSYALTLSSHNTGAVPKQTRPVFDSITSPRFLWTEQIRNIISNHNQGNRILIFMRGAPGSGKSYLARQIIDMCVGSSEYLYGKHIFSTDDYFMVRGVYVHKKYELSQAHDWNKRRADTALRQGLSPVIIDNTNIELWEMEPYLRVGVQNGYIVEIVEPYTPWAKNANKLLRKNIHNVPLHTIRRYLDNLISGYTGSDLINNYGLSYPANMVPPVKRNQPEVEQQNQSTSKTEIRSEMVVISRQSPTKTEQPSQPILFNDLSTVEAGTSNILNENKEQNQPQPVESTEILENVASEACSACTLNIFDENKDQKNSQTDEPSRTDIESNNQVEEDTKQTRYSEIEKQLEEILRVEEEWDNGEHWDDTSTVKDTDKQTPESPKPARSESKEAAPRENLLDAVKQCEDWRNISIFMPPWFDNKPNNQNDVEIPTVSLKHASTSIEIGDTDLQNPTKIYKILSASPRDINLFYIPPDKEKIPQKQTLDASTMTSDFLVTGAFRCNNEEQHFLSLRKMFRNIPKAALRDIFDNCCGDVNWAVGIILDGMANHQLTTVDDLPNSDTEEDIVELCNCLAAYNIVPSLASVATSSVINEENIPDCSEIDSVAIRTQKKSKVSPSESSAQLKRQIEKNFVIADNHYSEHCLKIRNFRRGELDIDVSNENLIRNPNPMSEVAQALPVGETNLVTTGPEFGPALGDLEQKMDNYIKQDEKRSPSTDTVAASSPDSDDDSSCASSFDGHESTININLGWDLIKKLDGIFGREGMTYPDNVEPKINIPVTLLNEINAYWIESLMTQMDEQDKLKRKLMTEDEEFARQIQMQEAELVRQGKEPEVPDFKEIMDMDLALSLYQKEVAEWRNSEPKDLAAIMTRDKLYNLFPDLSKDVLAELLMAHDNNFKATVESLLISTGKANVLESKTGLNKFVMERELARQQKILEEEQQALSEVEWPLLPQGEKLEMSAVNRYRKQAEQHLQKRQQNHEKATEYVRRGMPQVASHYSELAHFHTRQYDQSSSLAAACLVQIHASKCPSAATVDLHFLRVAEAKETLDLFVDTHICKLQESLAKGPGNGPRAHKLFFITGRGAHSAGGRAKVKPAVRKRLRERGLNVSECNPGLLTTQVTADDKLSYQVAA